MSRMNFGGTMNRPGRRAIGHSYTGITISGNARAHLGDMNTYKHYDAPGLGSLLEAVFIGNMITDAVKSLLRPLFGPEHICHHLAEQNPIILEQLARRAMDVGNSLLSNAFLETSVAVRKLKRVETRNDRVREFEKWEARDDAALLDLQKDYEHTFDRLFLGEHPSGSTVPSTLSNPYRRYRLISTNTGRNTELNDEDQQESLLPMDNNDETTEPEIGGETRTVDLSIRDLRTALTTEEHVSKPLEEVIFWSFTLTRHDYPQYKWWEFQNLYDPSHAPKEFFVPGRVFAAPFERGWKHGGNKVPTDISLLNTFAGRSGVLYFVAVFPMESHRWFCLPIQPYNEQGKKPFNRSQKNNEIQALIYDPTQASPVFVKDERPYELEPMKVCSSDGLMKGQLEYVCGLCLTNAFLVEEDLEAVDFGRIEPESMRILMDHWLDRIAVSIICRGTKGITQK